MYFYLFIYFLLSPPVWGNIKWFQPLLIAAAGIEPWWSSLGSVSITTEPNNDR
jgi:hypothetical protein